MHERRSRGPALVELAVASKSAPRHHLRRRATIHVGLVEDDVGAHVCWPGGQHLLLAINQIAGIEGRQLKSVSVGDRIRRTRFHAVAAENAAVVIDVVDLGIALGATDAVLRRVLSGFDVDAVRWARRRAQEAGHALLQAVLVALQHVGTAKASLNTRAAQRTLAVWIILHGRGLKHLHEGDAHALGNGRDVLQNWHLAIQYTERMAKSSRRPASGGRERVKRLE